MKGKEHYQIFSKKNVQLLILHYGKNVRQENHFGNPLGVKEDLVGILNVLLWQHLFLIFLLICIQVVLILSFLTTQMKLHKVKHIIINHNGHLHIDGLKMSKSLKNFITIKEILKTYTAN